MTDDKIQAAQRFIEKAHYDGDLKAQIDAIPPGQIDLLWEVAADAGYGIDEESFIAACRTPLVTMLPLEIERLTGPLQRLKWSLGDDQAQGFTPTHARSGERQKPDLHPTTPAPLDVTVHEDPPSDVMVVSSTSIENADHDGEEIAEAEQTRIKSPLEPSLLDQVSELGEMAQPEPALSLPKIKSLPPEANVPDTVAFIRMVDQNEALQNALKELDQHDFDAVWALAAEMGYHINMGTVSDACLDRKVTDFHPELARVIGNYFYWIK